MKLFLACGLVSLVLVACGGDDDGPSGNGGTAGTVATGGSGAGASGPGGGGAGAPLTDLGSATMKQVTADAQARAVTDHQGCGLATIVATALDSDGTLAEAGVVVAAWTIAFECSGDDRVVYRYEGSTEPTETVELPAGALPFEIDDAPDSPAIYQAYADTCMPSGMGHPILNVNAGQGGVDVILNGNPYWRALFDASGLVMEISACDM